MEALRKNLRQEHVLIHDFLSTFYTQARMPSVPPACMHACMPPRPWSA